MKRVFKQITILIMVVMLVAGSIESAMAAELAKVNLSVKQDSKTSVTLSWDKVSGADGYEIYRKTGKDGTYKKIKTITSGKTVSYKNKELTFGKKYYYKVRAYDKNGSTAKKGKYSSSKSVTMTYMQPNFTVYLPTTINKEDNTIVISLTNNSKSDKVYFDGIFAIEDLSDGEKLYSARSIKFSKPEKDVSGVLGEGKRLYLDPGEKVRFTCRIDGTFDYDRDKIRLTTCVRYKQKDFVSVYSTSGKNKIYTAQGYYDYLTGED